MLKCSNVQLCHCTSDPTNYEHTLSRSNRRAAIRLPVGVAVKYRTYGEHRKYRTQNRNKIQNILCAHTLVFSDTVHCARGFAMNWISMIQSNFTEAQAMPNTLNCGRKWKQSFTDALASLALMIVCHWVIEIVDWQSLMFGSYFTICPV